MEIDWSKAPEGFDLHFRAKRKNNVGGFYRVSPMNDRFVSESGQYILFGDMPSLVDLFDINSRPEVIEWTGSGLPPVGTVCEMIGCKADPETIDYEKYKNHIGKTVTIVAHHDVGRPAAVYACAVGDGEFEYYSMIAGCFAPIRTPEQIAAEIREAAIKDLMQIDDIYYQQAADIYDRGYRKFEIVDES